MAIKAYYQAQVSDFFVESLEQILGKLAAEHHHDLEQLQRDAWVEQISVLKSALSRHLGGRLFLEFSIPRMGKRADAVLITHGIVFVIEFKIGAKDHAASAVVQVEDYALDLKNFHEGSHSVPIVPVLVSTKAKHSPLAAAIFSSDFVSQPLQANGEDFGSLVDCICSKNQFPIFDVSDWASKGYKPTPTIVEAAQFLYQTHSVTDIRRNDAAAKNLQETSDCISSSIDHARRTGAKVICFVTGVPGSGKTLAGLNFATKRSDEHKDEHAVFLSGNGPLVAVLREALARDKSRRERISKKTSDREVSSFIQNIHHFRNEYLANADIPIEKVVVFDEAQRAWNREQAAHFMRQKRGQQNFEMSEPEFLISVMDRHKDWCAIVCLVGGGQEINKGEAGISEWINALASKFQDWQVFISSRIVLPDYGVEDNDSRFLESGRVRMNEHLHLAVSMRSFRAENLSAFVGYLLDNEPHRAKEAYDRIRHDYPILLTRDFNAAKGWLRRRARGSERFGLVASSGAQRLRPEGIHMKSKIDPPVWFLNDVSDVRSSYYLEEVASEFDIQGLELEWVGVCWDGDFHYKTGKWNSQMFKGTKWLSVNDASKRLYLRNAYRVLLTRARQGMVIFVPNSDGSDKTRPPQFYEGTYDFLRECGIPELV